MSEMPAVRGLSEQPQFPPVQGRTFADVHAISRPARTFTGDFYFTHRRDNRFWFAHGDVAGKGLPAAVVMAMIQEELEHQLTACANAGGDPATIVCRLNEFLHPLLPPNRFATMVVGHLDDDGSLTIANAGHCPPIIIRRDGSTELVGSTGPLVGVLPNAAWQSREEHLARGESVALYSDGIIESTDSLDRELGVAGLRNIVGLLPFDSARGLAESIVASLDGRDHADDTTLVVLRRA